MTPVSFEVSLFGDPRIEARLPAPRGLSQVTTSFIGSWCLGIHRLPLVACYFTTKMLASTVQFSRNGRAQVTIPCGVDRLVRSKALRLATDPSGPNSVLGFRHAGFEVPLRRGGCTDEPAGSTSGQCSTRCLPSHRTIAGERDGWTGLITPCQ